MLTKFFKFHDDDVNEVAAFELFEEDLSPFHIGWASLTATKNKLVRCLPPGPERTSAA